MKDNSQILDLIILICDKIIKMKNVYDETDWLLDWMADHAQWYARFSLFWTYDYEMRKLEDTSNGTPNYFDFLFLIIHPQIHIDGFLYSEGPGLIYIKAI